MIGTSGKGGVDGGNGGNGNPTSITAAYTNELVAGFSGADRTGGGANAGHAADSSGGRGANGQGTGGAGGRLPNKEGQGEIASQSGGRMTVAGVTTGTPGVGGSHDGGGGGGAGFGDGGAGKSSDAMFNKDDGNKGGNGFVRLS